MTSLEEAAAKERAAEAWALMLDHRAALPVGVALDMVQDCGGDRDDAIYCLVGAAADWLAGQMPAERPEPGPQSNRDEAVAVCGYVRCESFGLAEGCREALYRRTLELRVASGRRTLSVLSPLVADAHQWGEWCVKARRAIEQAAAVAGTPPPPRRDK